MPEYIDRTTEAVAEAIWRVDAPRYGNDVFPWTEVKGGQRVLCLEKARAAIRCLRESENAVPTETARPETA